jgi:L-seryl-tRNA(Ser) seleniumtransferase
MPVMVFGHNRPHSASESRRAKSRTIAAGSAGSATVSGFGQTGNPYDELGVTTVINCEGTMTILGGSILRPELEAVMAMDGRHFVSIPDLDVAAAEHAGMRTRRLQFVAKRSRSEK